MEVTENPIFKAKYDKHKIRVKLWESDFMEKFGRKPNKNDIKTADMTIRDSYKMYWKLKTSALEETLTEINFCKDSLDLLPANTISELINYPEKKQIDSKSINLENTYPINHIPKISTSSTILFNNLNVEGVWDQSINKSLNENYVKTKQEFSISRSSFQLSQNLFKSLNFSKRNPRKYKMQKNKIELCTFSNNSKNCTSNNTDCAISNILKTSLNDNLKVICETKTISDQPTIQQLIERYKTSCNKELNKNWLDKCIENDLFTNNSLETLKISQNSKLKFESFETLSTQNLYYKSFSDDEDYVCNSDSEQERKTKRIRNFNKNFYDCELQPFKRLCKMKDDSYNTKMDKQDLNSTIINNSEDVFSNKFENMLSYEKYIYSVDTSNFQNRNNPEKKMVKLKKFEENTTKIKNISYTSHSHNKFNKLINKQNFISNEYKDENISNDNVKNLVDQVSIKNCKSSNTIQFLPVNRTLTNDIRDLACICEPINQEKNTLLVNKKSYKRKKSNEHSSNMEKLNENFIKINLKKKVFIRGKKIFNLSKYKKNHWKQRKKEINFYKNDTKLINSLDIDHKFQCSKSEQINHFSKYCKNFKDNLLLFDTNTDINRYSTMKQVEEMSKLNPIRSINLSIPHKRCNNISTIHSETVNCNYNCFNCSDFKNSQTESILDKKISLINYTKSENFIEMVIPEAKEVPSLYELQPDNSVKDAPLEVIKALKKFGHSKFQLGQEKAIMRILSGQSTLVTMATGSGKSLCYQLPAYMYGKKNKCITLVISPLISLMDDQISRIPNFLKAACLHTNQNPKTQEKILANLKKANLNILLISPELIVRSDVISNSFGKILDILPPIAFVCIDEAHCISQWSHNFRPAYFTICNVLKEKLGVKRFLGLTATANKSTIMHIINFLNIIDESTGVISQKSVPTNLNLTVSRDLHKEHALIKLLQSKRYIGCDSIIVYCTRREECIKLAKLLRISLKNQEIKQVYRKSKISSIAEAYHAGLSANWRKMVQTSFMKSEIRIIVATVAFGMGINKSNIRSVIHFNMPPNFEGYVQEIGRAGRDGLPAYCHLFLNSQENCDEYELLRHINAKRIDRHTIRRLLQKIFIPCYCIKHDLKLRCQGHEIAFPVDETVKMLDLSEEAITTLLCYLELHSKHFKLLPPTYINAKISSDKGCSLNIAAKSTPSLGMALSLLMKNGNYNCNSSIIEFSVIDIASTIGLNSSIVKKQLKNLEWITINGKTKKSEISVHFDTLGFHVMATGDLSDVELEETLDYLSEQNFLHTTMCIKQLKLISTTMRKFSFASVNECFEPNQETWSKSEELKNTIRNYFELDTPLSNISISSKIKLENKVRIIVDIRNLILSYKEIHFTGRIIARIFHGIQSPNYSALLWSKSPFWRAYINEDFDAISQLATKEILKIKKI